MRKGFKRLLWIAPVIALVFVFVVLSRPGPLKVAVAEVERSDVRSSVANTRAGTVVACRRALLAPQIGGQIANLYVTEGDVVKQGELLLELWNDDRKAELLLAERSIRASRVRAEEACTIAATADKEAKRLTRLLSQGLASQEDTEAAVGRADATEAGCRAARALIDVSEATRDIATASLAKTRLKAPFAGTVAEINGEIGEFVTPSPVGIPTLPAVDLVDNSCLYISAPIDEVDAPAIRVGMPARITMDAFPGQFFAGHVRRVAPYVLDLEKQARTVEVEAEIDTIPADQVLLPGYSADLEIVLAERKATLRIPTQAIDDGRVLVLGDDGILRERSISTGIGNWEYTEILDGLEAGERVVVSVDRAGVVAGAVAQAE
ncbi:MAG: efflux RND transporter periplasmic adaptor subunit [Proteobacteria bacterium]|nr:efflux RND transporter periplasmic adaptor subunit [Pseudomonadota bacterium]